MDKIEIPPLMETGAIAIDVIAATENLVGRAGALKVEIGWDCPHLPLDDEDDQDDEDEDGDEGHECSEARWYVTAHYADRQVSVRGHLTPSAAALAMAEAMLFRAMCRCGQRVRMADDRPGCRWRLMGNQWMPGCDAPPMRYKGEPGDLDALSRAAAARAAERN